ncbi:MAG: (Fe-S)-binding protein, partial [Candidatus Moranbacteria bacterium]|nr:(Fe-S)-binding protein [Candidatus Moranbacteria bacterium]
MNIFKKIFRGNTLYYPGCLTKFALKDIQDNYEEILRQEGIDFIKLSEKELCCGSPAKNAGGQKLFKELALKNLKIFKEHSVGRIITNCPACALVLREDYKKLLGDKWDIEVRHMTEIISDKSLKKFRGQDRGAVTYHDPCHLGRALKIYEEPREIIKKAGYKIKEMDLNREKSYCCGAGGGVKTNNPELSNRIVGDRFDQARKIKAKEMIT